MESSITINLPENDLQRNTIISIKDRYVENALKNLPKVRPENVELEKKRIALVIGIANYKEKIDRLPNAINDAKHMEAVLSRAGFKVTCLLNCNNEELIEGIYDFARNSWTDLGSRDLVSVFNTECVIYYAGHGKTLRGEAVWLPNDYNDQRNNVRIDRDIVQPLMGKDPLMTLVLILDCCRSGSNSVASRNQFEYSTNPIQPHPRLIAAFAASTIAREAEDHGLFTKHLLEFIDLPLTCQEVFNLTIQAVIEETGPGGQIPILVQVGGKLPMMFRTDFCGSLFDYVPIDNVKNLRSWVKSGKIFNFALHIFFKTMYN